MPMLESSHVEVGYPPEPSEPNQPGPDEHEPNQRRRMLIALGILLLALIVVIVRDRAFLFPPSADSEVADVDDQTTTITSAPPESPAAAPTPAAPKGKQHAAPASGASAAASSGGPVIVASNRAVLPPLEVEVVVGDHHQAIPSASTPVKVDMESHASSPPAATAAAPSADERVPVGASSAATGRVRVSADAARVISRPVQPTYPILARQMKVQGAVVLQALIGKEGGIQDLQVLSGPAILSVAAREAVKQWRFKPYYEAGEPVETQARITVNFTISTN